MKPCAKGRLFRYRLTGGRTQQIGLVEQAAKAIAEAIEKLARDPVLRKGFTSESLGRMEKLFSVENMVTNTRRLYESLLS
jgi:glycosyltransferase involved in cell wall biosynthesis